MKAKLNVSGFSPVSQDELVMVNGGWVKEVVGFLVGLFSGGGGGGDVNIVTGNNNTVGGNSGGCGCRCDR